MANPKPSKDADADAKAPTSVSNTFPGYDDALRLLDLSEEHLRFQGELWNDAWAEIAQGKFELKSWAKTVATSMDRHWKYARSLLREEVPSTQAPPWVRLDWAAGAKAPSRISPPLPGTIGGDPYCTDFCPLGSGEAPKGLPRAIAERGPGQKLNIRFSDPNTKPPPDGLYIAFVFAQGQGYAPILIVLLQVGGEVAEEPPETTEKASTKKASARKASAKKASAKKAGAKKASA